MRLGIIGGTNASLETSTWEKATIETAFGPAHIETGRLGPTEVVFVRRHGPNHERLSSSVEHRANIRALADAGVSAIVGTTVCGVIDPALSLGGGILFDDLLFPDNRLPDGSPCTFFDTPSDPMRGHLIAPSPFSASLRELVARASQRAGVELHDGGTYAYALGPRFNTKPEIAWFAACGATAVSQTAGPEAVLAAELEVPYCLLGFGVDYANGVSAVPTPAEEIGRNVGLSVSAFSMVLGALAEGYEPLAFDTGFIYRMEGGA